MAHKMRLVLKGGYENVWAKVTKDLFKNKDFKKILNKLLINMHIKPGEFEKKWELIIIEFNLEDKIWFNDLFGLHGKWIPAYFNDTRIYGLINTQNELDHETKKAVYKSVSPRLIEKYATKMGIIQSGTTRQKQRFQKRKLEVEIKLPKKDVKCSCQHFICIWTLCRHIFNIIMKHGIKEIHEYYIENSWRKDVISRHYYFGRHVYVLEDSEINRSVNLTYYNFKSCLDFLRKNKHKMDSFVSIPKDIPKGYENDPINEVPKNRTDVEEVGWLMGVSIPKDILKNVPNVQSNKGSGKNNRIQSAAEKSYKSQTSNQ
ncbi:hypothetical protein Lser_V15G27962 [Lactuca serriola]